MTLDSNITRPTEEAGSTGGASRVAARLLDDIRPDFNKPYENKTAACHLQAANPLDKENDPAGPGINRPVDIFTRPVDKQHPADHCQRDDLGNGDKPDRRPRPSKPRNEEFGKGDSNEHCLPNVEIEINGHALVGEGIKTPDGRTWTTEKANSEGKWELSNLTHINEKTGLTETFTKGDDGSWTRTVTFGQDDQGNPATTTEKLKGEVKSLPGGGYTFTSMDGTVHTQFGQTADGLSGARRTETAEGITTTFKFDKSGAPAQITQTFENLSMSLTKSSDGTWTFSETVDGQPVGPLPRAGTNIATKVEIGQDGSVSFQYKGQQRKLLTGNAGQSA